jgi:hypothetical protein
MATKSQPTPSNPTDTLESVLQEWANARGRTTVCVTSTGKSNLGDRHVIRLWARLQGVHDRVDLIINSNGGDAHSAFQIAELIRRRMKDQKAGLTGVVPFRAASAATLMCLGCDELMLDDLARLGPLDAQIYEEAKGGAYKRVSALNPQEAIKQLNESAIASMMATKNALVNDGVLAGEAYEIAKDLAIGLFSTMYGQLSPERLAEYSRTLAIGREYAICLLKRHSKLPPADQVTVVDKLVKGYPSHGYYIDHLEAAEMKLKVVEVPSNLKEIATRLLVQVVSADSDVFVALPATAPAPAKTSPVRPSTRRGKIKKTKKPTTRSKRMLATAQSSTNGRGKGQK